MVKKAKKQKTVQETPKPKTKTIVWKQIDKTKWEAQNEEGWKLIVRSVGAKDNLIFGAHNAHGNYSCYLGSEKTLDEAKALAESGERKEPTIAPIPLEEVKPEPINHTKVFLEPGEKKTRKPRASANSPGRSQVIVILQKDNPFALGSKRHAFFELVLESKTVGDFMKAGGLNRELDVFISRKLIKVEDPS